ncbi:MAG: response regulator transcription factor [Selenomonadales bacterium]|nr:response regulator transcription factor [Selenomonadales bacterium]
MIWCVEDDSNIRDIELYALNSAGFEVRGFEDGLSFWEALKTERPSLIILDIMLPGMDGIEILTKMKESVEYRSIPVILASAKGQEYDRIKGLDMGADDYIVKPFSIMEMISRVKAVLRRSQPRQFSKVLKIKGLVINLDEHTVVADGEHIQLTYKEFELLCMFLSHPGMVFTREQLYTQVWQTDYIGDSRTLDTHIRTLRQKLHEYGKIIETVRGVGYRLGAQYDR